MRTKKENIERKIYVPPVITVACLTLRAGLLLGGSIETPEMENEDF